VAPDLEEDSAACEARIFARYLVGLPAPVAAVARYREGRRTIWGESADADPHLAFVRRHPWSVASLDAAASLFRRDGVLHGSILTMAAVLETLPELADEFLPRPVSRSALLGHLVTASVKTVFYVTAGVCLLPLAGRSRS